MTSWGTWGGYERLPDLTEKEQKAFARGDFPTFRKSAHVQALNTMIVESRSVDPAELVGRVLEYEGEGRSYFVLLTQHDDGTNLIKGIALLGQPIPGGILYPLLSMTRQDLLRESLLHQPRKITTTQGAA